MQTDETELKTAYTVVGVSSVGKVGIHRDPLKHESALYTIGMIFFKMPYLLVFSFQRKKKKDGIQISFCRRKFTTISTLHGVHVMLRYGINSDSLSPRL